MWTAAINTWDVTLKYLQVMKWFSKFYFIFKFDTYSKVKDCEKSNIPTTSSSMTVDDETSEALRQIHTQLKLDEEVFLFFKLRDKSLNKFGNQMNILILPGTLWCWARWVGGPKTVIIQHIWFVWHWYIVTKIQWIQRKVSTKV